jgi:hypothetical protein
MYIGRFMKSMVLTVSRSVMLIFLGISCAVAAAAQDARIEIGRLDALSAKAAETVEVSLDEKLLRVAAKFLKSDDPEEAKVKELVAGLKGVYVRVFEFEKPGEYSPGDLDPLRSQLQAPGWTKIVGVKSKREGENVDVHIKYQGENISGLAIIAAEPNELAIINIIGPIDLEKLSSLGGQFGIPRLELEKEEKKTKRK